jgi:hypothetical protein
MEQKEINEAMFWGLSLIGMFIPIVIFGAVILYSMYKDGTSYGRKIPMPPPHLNPKYKNYGNISSKNN